MTNILDEALAGKYRTIPKTNSYFLKEKSQEEVIVEKPRNRKKELALAFTGLAIASIAAVSMSRSDALNQYVEFVGTLINKSKNIIDDSVKIKEESVSIFDEATNTVKMVLKKLQSQIDDGSFIPTDDALKRFSFSDEAQTLFSAKIRKKDNLYQVSSIRQKTKDNATTSILCDENGVVSAIERTFLADTNSGSTISKLYLYSKNKLSIFMENFSFIKNKELDFAADKVLYFENDLVGYVDDIVCNYNKKTADFCHLFKFRDKQLNKIRTGTRLPEGFAEYLNKEFVLENNQLKSALPLDTKLPDWYYEFVDVFFGVLQD